MGNRVSYRNAYARASVEEVRALIVKQSESFGIQIKDELQSACQEFVDYYGSEMIFPVKTGNLIDSFGVGVYKGDVLYGLYTLPQRATKAVRTGFIGLSPVAQVTTRYGSIRDVISGRRELEAMSNNATISPAKLNRAGLLTKNTIMAIMYVAAPYARAVPEKGYWGGEHGVPRNQYYTVLEYNFEHELIKRLQDLYPTPSGTTPYRTRYHMPNM